MGSKQITEKKANEAREQWAEFLRQAGAHAVTVDEITRKGNKTFAVVALVEKKTTNLPKELEIGKGDKTIKVPLVVKASSKFKLE